MLRLYVRDIERYEECDNYSIFFAFEAGGDELKMRQSSHWNFFICIG